MITGRAAALLIILFVAGSGVLAVKAQAAPEPTCETYEAVATQAHGAILALVGPAGNCAGGPGRRTVYRFLPDGTADASFARNGVLTLPGSRPILFETDGGGRLVVVTWLDRPLPRTEVTARMKAISGH